MRRRVLRGATRSKQKSGEKDASVPKVRFEKGRGERASEEVALERGMRLETER